MDTMGTRKSGKQESDPSPGSFGIRISDTVNWYLGLIWWLLFVIIGGQLLIAHLNERRFW